MSANFNFTNPDHLIYEHELLKLSVLGGIKLEGLDRMRSTLKIQLKESAVPPLRHNIDLYNDTQVEKLIRRTAEKLEIGTSIIAASIAQLTEQLETYRIQQIKENEPKPFESPKLTAQEQKDAETFLKQENLLQRTNEMIGKSGMIGEENNRLIMYLIFTSRKRSQPLHIVSLGSSGTGKTHLQEKVGELIPEEDKIEITTLSENAFYYFGQRELKNKLILIEDLDGAENVLYPLRELQSKKRISKTIAHKNTKGETRTIHLIVEGPVSVSGCTTREQIYEDNANRSFLIYLDESEEQDNRIMNYQRRASAGNIDTYEEEKAAELLRNCQRILEPIKIVNPYAELLQIPKEIFKPRRTNNHYLQFIEAITFYHQHQRKQEVDEETGEIYIETTLEDIEQANQLMKNVLLRKSDELNGACRNYLEELKKWLKEKNKTKFGNREISRDLRIPISTVKRHHKQLVELGHLFTEKEKKGKAFHYCLSALGKEDNESKIALIDKVLNEALTEVEKLTNGSIGSVSAQNPNEPLKAMKVSKKSTSAQTK
ncbi:MAG: hypothetical protein CMH30_05725 [Micavibrio sp.]|nr:hypothetical protein [Micavibrio sp.]|tara:strand:+ start:1860 stop:3488 length:1629 start_codon:yes stop_codon:yes gene_type:complete